MGQQKTVDQCKALLASRLEEFNRGVDRCVKVPMSAERRAAVVSFTYNVGEGALCKSTFARRLNAKDPLACDELMKWTKAKGVMLPGLVRRRQEERRLCMKG
jgi:lysozyme